MEILEAKYTHTYSPLVYICIVYIYIHIHTLVISIHNFNKCTFITAFNGSLQTEFGSAEWIAFAGPFRGVFSF